MKPARTGPGETHQDRAVGPKSGHEYSIYRISRADNPSMTDKSTASGLLLVPWISSLCQGGPMLPSVSHAFRILRKDPVFTAVAICTVAIGIGATASMFSFADAMLLRPLPVPRSRSRPGHQHRRVRAVRPEPAHFLSGLHRPARPQPHLRRSGSRLIRLLPLQAESQYSPAHEMGPVRPSAGSTPSTRKKLPET